MVDDELRSTQHHWSGWPGAFCFKCGRDDPYEQAFADGDTWYDEVPGDHPEDEPKLEFFYKDDATKERLRQESICPVRGILEYDTDFGWWILTVAGAVI